MTINNTLTDFKNMVVRCTVVYDYVREKEHMGLVYTLGNLSSNPIHPNCRPGEVCFSFTTTLHVLENILSAELNQLCYDQQLVGRAVFQPAPEGRHKPRLYSVDVFFGRCWGSYGTMQFAVNHPEW